VVSVADRIDFTLAQARLAPDQAPLNFPLDQNGVKSPIVEAQDCLVKFPNVSMRTSMGQLEVGINGNKSIGCPVSGACSAERRESSK
jgi:hypothetical protein